MFLGLDISIKTEELNYNNQALYSAVDEVLHYIWDPIGVSGVPQARDEYRFYVPHVFNLLHNGASKESICAYLRSIVTERMGVSANPPHDIEVVSVLVAWKESLDEKNA